MTRRVRLLSVVALALLLQGCQPEAPPCDVAPRAVAVEAVPEDAQAVVDVGGTWDWNLYYAAGRGHHGTWSFTQDGDQVLGTYEGACHPEQGNVKGFLQGNKIVINDGRIRYMGTIGDGSMKGTWVAVDDPTASPQDWDAVRGS